MKKILFVLLFTVVVFAASYKDLNSIATYLFDDVNFPDVTTDHSANSYTLSANGGVGSETVTSPWGSPYTAVHFTTDDYYSTTEDFDMTTDDWTFIFYFRTTSNFDYNFVFGAYVDASNRWYAMVDEEGECKFFSRAGGSTRFNVSTNDGAITPGTWYHVAITDDFSEQEAKMYIDGIEITYKTQTHTGVTLGLAVDNDFNIGLYDGNYFEGDIMYVVRYDRVLNLEEIQRSMNLSYFVSLQGGYPGYPSTKGFPE